MCTVFLAKDLYAHSPLVIAANRDERFDRRTDPPSFWTGRLTMLALRDLERGGTCIGVNERGVFSALTNHVNVTSIGGQRSRGELVVLANRHHTAADAIAEIACLHAREYNGFHLIVADDEEVFTAVGGGADGPEHPIVTRLPDGPGTLIVTNLGIGPTHSPRAEAIMGVWEQDALAHTTPHRATWSRLLTIHAPHPPDDATWMKRMASSCIHRPAAELYGTRSSAYVELSPRWGSHAAEWRYWHHEGHACNDSKWQRLTLPIR